MKTLSKKIAAGLLIGSICLSLGAAALANQSSSAEQGKQSSMRANKIMAQHSPQMMEAVQAKLDKLVADGVITSEQEDKIVAFGKEKITQFKADMDKMHGMIPEERQAYFKELGKKMPDVFAELKATAELTDDQAKIVVATLRPEPPMMNPEMLAKKLDKLITGGVIDQTQADKVINYMQEKAGQMRAAMEKVQQMSPEERQAFFKEQHKNPGAIVAELKAAVGLTDDQAKAVLEAIRPQYRHGEHRADAQMQ